MHVDGENAFDPKGCEPKATRTPLEGKRQARLLKDYSLEEKESAFLYCYVVECISALRAEIGRRASWYAFHRRPMERDKLLLLKHYISSQRLVTWLLPKLEQLKPLWWSVYLGASHRNRTQSVLVCIPPETDGTREVVASQTLHLKSTVCSMAPQNLNSPQHGCPKT